jgi:hypothetical protein
MREGVAQLPKLPSAVSALPLAAVMDDEMGGAAVGTPVRPAEELVEADTPATSRPWWGVPAIVVAVLAVAAAGFWGVRGLFGDPVKGTDAQGVTTIQGAWQPYTCGSPCIGYVQAGSRSVTVILPGGCPEPVRDSTVTVRGTLDTSQGKGTYRALACP